MLAIVDYGVGNLFSLKSSLDFIGKESVITSERDIIEKADRLILPGVGAFGDAVRKLRESSLDSVICRMAEKSVPIMGICLGMQMLFERSYEYGVHEGLSLIKGCVRPISETIPENLKIPHMGWNSLHFHGSRHPIFKYINDGDYVYFVHSYHAAECEASLIADTEYGVPLTAAAACGSVCGCQFHPEKSGKTGLNILRGFCEWEGL